MSPLNLYLNIVLCISSVGMQDFSMPIPMPHSMAAAAAAAAVHSGMPAEFWPHNFNIHPAAAVAAASMHPSLMAAHHHHHHAGHPHHQQPGQPHLQHHPHHPHHHAAAMMSAGYKLPNLSAILSQYMGFFAYPQNLSANAAAAAAATPGARVSPATTHSTGDSPSPKQPETDK